MVNQNKVKYCPYHFTDTMIESFSPTIIEKDILCSFVCETVQLLYFRWSF